MDRGGERERDLLISVISLLPSDTRHPYTPEQARRLVGQVAPILLHFIVNGFSAITFSELYQSS